MKIIRYITQSMLTIALVAGVSVAQADTLVISKNNNSIVIFDDTGAFVSSVALPAGAAEPRDIAQAPSGDIFVLRGDSQVQRFDSGLNFIESWMANNGQYGINVDDAGLVYVAGSGSPSVGVYNASGVLQSTLTPSGGSNLRDTVQVGLNTWVSNFTGPKIDVMDPGGSDIGDIASPLAPFGMQKAPNGDVWVVGQNDHEVRRITAAGSLAFSFDADDGPNGVVLGQLRYLGVGPDGKLYIPHRGTTIVDVYSDTGVHIATLTDASLSGPDGILVTGAFSSGKASQTISGFAASPTTGTVGGTSTLSATASSGLTVTFDSNTPAICTVAGNTVSYVTTGTCTVAADQAGDASFLAAAQVTLDITVGKLTQAISGLAASPASGEIGGTSTLSATASSGLTVTFDSTTATVCTVTGTTVSYLLAGTCTVTADQAGDATYDAAAQVTMDITVTAAVVVPPATPIPTLSWLGLATMLLIMLGIGGIASRRRTSAK